MLESVCDVMDQFAESYDRNARRTTYMRTSSKDGGAISLENIQITGDTHQQLKFAVSGSNCSTRSNELCRPFFGGVFAQR